MVATKLQTKALRSKRRISPCIFQVVAFLPTKALFVLTLPTLAQTVQDYTLQL
jgi:hypothetical protein